MSGFQQFGKETQSMLVTIVLEPDITIKEVTYALKKLMPTQTSLATLYVVSRQKGEDREKEGQKCKSWFYFPYVSASVLSGKVRKRRTNDDRENRCHYSKLRALLIPGISAFGHQNVQTVLAVLTQTKCTKYDMVSLL